MKAVHSLITLVAAVLLIACGSKQPPTLFEGTTAQDAVNQITAKLSRPIRVLQIEITPNSLSMQIQDSTALNHVDEYRYNQAGILHRDSVSGPRPVQLSLINPKLEENLYNIEEVSLIAVPDTIREALKRIALEGGGMVERIEIKRRVSIIPVPQNGDVRWTISVRSPRETATAYADAQGHISSLDLEGTERAKTVDFTEGGMLLDQVVSKIRESFGGIKSVFPEIHISPKRIWFRVRGTEPPHAVKSQICDLDGLHDDVYGDLEKQMFPGVIESMAKARHEDVIPESQCFALDEIDWSKLPDLRKAAIEQMGDAHVGIPGVKLRRRVAYGTKPVEWEFTIGRGFDRGFVDYDTKGNRLRFQLPLAPTIVPDLLEPENTRVILNAIRDDFGPQTQLREIRLRKDDAFVTAAPPGHPEQLWEYSYSLRDGMKFSSDALIFHPTEAGKINADEVAKLAEALPELKKKAMARLGPAGGTVDTVTFYREESHASNKKLLIQINLSTGVFGSTTFVIYDSTGRFVSVR